MVKDHSEGGVARNQDRHIKKPFVGDIEFADVDLKKFRKALEERADMKATARHVVHVNLKDLVTCLKMQTALCQGCTINVQATEAKTQSLGEESDAIGEARKVIV